MKRVLFFWVSFFGFFGLEAAMVSESARNVPVIHDVDVVVVGGSSAAVSAACAAHDAGASVFLAAEQMYLGDDVAGTLRLALREGENPYRHPLASKIWGEGGDRSGLPFAYQTSSSSIGKHQDSTPPKMLVDGVFDSVATKSVEYNGAIDLTVDLEEDCELSRVTLMAFRRERGFDIHPVELSGSRDGKRWTMLGKMVSEVPYTRDAAHPFMADVEGTFRYLKLKISPSANRRILLGELIIDGVPAQASVERAVVVPRPMRVKRVLEQELLQRGIPFLFTCSPAGVLIDADGVAAGVVIADRAGRQAIRAKVVIDATPRAALARELGAEFTTFPEGSQTFSFVTISEQANEGEGIVSAKTLPVPHWEPAVKELMNRSGSGKYPTGAPTGYESMFHEYELSISMKDGSFDSYAVAEQKVRSLTWDKTLIDAADLVFSIPPDALKGPRTVDTWDGAEELPLDVFQAKENLFVLNGCVSVSRSVAEQILRPVAFMQIGSRVGQAAAEEAAQRTVSEPVILKAAPAGDPIVSGDVRELLDGVRPGAKTEKTVPQAKASVPVLGRYDVVVVGGGTGGAPAAIAAAREGARVLLIERFHGLGGVGTLGRIGVYCGGNREGFTKELDDELLAMGRGALTRTPHDWPVWNLQWKREWYRQEILKMGGSIWFGTTGCGAFVDGNRVRGVVVATPQGRGIVLADVVIDATGNSDIPVAAGAPFMFTDENNVAMQGTGLPMRNPYTIAREKHPGYANNDWTFVDESDLLDVWRLQIGAREKMKSDFDTASLINSRERRRIVGEYVISPTDILADRTYPDSIAHAHSIFDTHGFTTHPVWTIKQPGKHGSHWAYVPYRSLVPKSLDGVLVCALGISAHRDAMPVLRMQPDVQNTGYAAGLAAAQAVQAGIQPRAIDVSILQRKLVAKGCIPQTVLTDQDSVPVSDEQFRRAVQNPLENHQNLAMVLNEFDRALPLLRNDFEKQNRDEKLQYAKFLGIMGDPAGSENLLNAVRDMEWDEGWNFRGGGQFGGNMSELDCLIVAMGRTAGQTAVPVLVEKIDALGSGSEFSHFRAVAIASEEVGDPALAEALYRVFQRLEIEGYSISPEKILNSGSPKYYSGRSQTLRELILARALYRCGDHKGLGKSILENYANDVRGHYAGHARDVLKTKK